LFYYGNVRYGKLEILMKSVAGLILSNALLASRAKTNAALAVARSVKV